MRRAAFLLPLLLAVPATALAAPRSDGNSTDTPPPLAAKLTACDVGPAPADRSAGFEGSMPAIDGASTLGMRFTLQMRPGATGRFRTQSAPTFGRWISSDPGAAGYVFDKSVDGLAPGAQYRVLIRFRWQDKGGKLVRSAQKTSAICRQPDLRPDLSVSAIDVAPGATAGQSVYTVTVANGGRGAIAAPFDVTLQLGAGVPLTMSVPSLDAGASTPVSFDAPTCRAGTQLRAVADPAEANAVDETREGNNSLVQACS